MSSSSTTRQDCEAQSADISERVIGEYEQMIDRLIATAQPIPLPVSQQELSSANPIDGVGVYLRTDYTARINTGGSYGHTCYVAKELAATTRDFVCFMPNRFGLLDEMGLSQRLIPTPSQTGDEASLIRANGPYYEYLAKQVPQLQPVYIYERICLGNVVGVRLSQEFCIPYIVEYNGSEISMRRSFDCGEFECERFFLKAEEAAFKQATLISVISEAVRDDLLRRGISPEKIMVNPNGVDLQAYAPMEPNTRNLLRRELGFKSSDRVVGFIGTFGGWHGIDVLAEALPLICERDENIRFLLIGDGGFKHLIEDSIRHHNLANRVVCTGRVPHQKGAQLLGVCDIYVSPHSSHMVDSRFFGSPTKLFEYMAMGGGIVASDLEQIGEVLSPALYATNLADSFLPTQERSILCTPGSVGEFVDAVVFLSRHPEICSAIGRNAREAAEADFSWRRHIARLWRFASNINSKSAKSPAVTRGHKDTINNINMQIKTGDEYKDEVQNQWDNNPCGSQYVKNASQHTLDWFLEVERYRYEEYAPWMYETMEFARHSGERILEIGGGLGTDLAQFAKHGAITTDIDLSCGHLAHAQENFKLRELVGIFLHQDAEILPFQDESFDVVYSNGVIHHTPNTQRVVDEIYRVLKPGGKAIVMVYAENSLHYWRNLVGFLGLRQNMLETFSIGEIMSRHVEITENDARPLVKVYTKQRLRKLFAQFQRTSIVQRQMIAAEVPRVISWIALPLLGKMMGWNLIIKAQKPI
jgi:glycosyltransferase involved in cell wall biosynthesis/ubiquinone/menaquinone biosynthesis C-methylase UbiE